MRISDWSSDVCSSDLQRLDAERILEREDLDADELGQHRVDAEERGQRAEPPRGAVVDEAVHAMGAAITSAARDLRCDTGGSLASLGMAGEVVTAVRVLRRPVPARIPGPRAGSNRAKPRRPG